MRYDLADLVVDSLSELSEHKILLSKWSAFLRALSSEESKTSDDNYADRVKQRVILRMMVTSARKAMEQDEATETLTLALLRALPGLLVSFRSDPLVLQSLVVLPQFMKSSVFGLTSRHKEFQSLLRGLCDIMLECTDKKVLLDCGLSLAVLVRSEHPRKQEVLVAVTEVAAKLRGRLGALIGDEKTGLGSNDSTTENIHSSIHLSTLRLLAISKHISICRLGAQVNPDDELEVFSSALSGYLEGQLTQRKVVVKEDDDGEKEVEIPDIWESPDISEHEAIANAVSASFTVLLTELAWKFLDDVKTVPDAKQTSSADSEKRVVIRVRDRLIRLITLGFEMFLEEVEGVTYTDALIRFSMVVQKSAIRCANDLRTLFPQKLSEASSDLLKSCSIADFDPMIGGAVDRFLSVLDQPVSCARQKSNCV